MCASPSGLSRRQKCLSSEKNFQLSNSSRKPRSFKFKRESSQVRKLGKKRQPPVLNVNNCETRDVLSNPVGDASISFVSRNPLLGPDIESLRKDDISEIDRPSAAAVTGVSIMPCSPSFSRGLCVILKTSLFTASAQQSFKVRLSETRLLNCGKKPASFVTSADVSDDQRIGINWK